MMPTRMMALGVAAAILYAIGYMLFALWAVDRAHDECDGTHQVKFERCR